MCAENHKASNGSNGDHAAPSNQEGSSKQSSDNSVSKNMPGTVASNEKTPGKYVH